MYVDWRAVNGMYCGVMWALAIVLALALLVHGLPAPSPSSHQILHAVPR